MHGIEIRYENGVLEVMLPSLLPKRKQRQSTEFLIDPVYFALNNYADHHPMPKFSHCVVCFSHIYSRELPARRVRDYDNLELKQLLDVISTFIMADDSGLLCDAYNHDGTGGTRLYLYFGYGSKVLFRMAFQAPRPHENPYPIFSGFTAQKSGQPTRGPETAGRRGFRSPGSYLKIPRVICSLGSFPHKGVIS